MKLIIFTLLLAVICWSPIWGQGANDPCQTTPSGGYEFLGEYNGSYYYQSLNFQKPEIAQNIAFTNGGHLAVINDQAENDFLQQNISEMVYIGLNDVTSEGTLEWQNGDSVDYTNFTTCLFCNDNEDNLDYVMMHPWDGGWSWSSQWNSRSYVIEIPCGSSGTSDLELELTTTQTSVSVGEQFTVTVSISNIGPDDATNVTSEYFRYPVITSFANVIDEVVSHGQISNVWYNEKDWYIPTLQVGETAQLILTYVAVSEGTFSALVSITNLDQEDPTPMPLREIEVTISEITGCPNDISGFTTIGELGNSKYYVSNENAINALDAQAIAESYGGNLASINSQVENDFIQQGISELSYIGLNDKLNEGVLEWYDGNTVDFINFQICSFCNDNTSAFNNVMMHQWDGGWSWSNTSNPRKFVMEIPCTGSPTGADLAMSATASVTDAFPGDPIQVILSVTNNGPEDATNIYILNWRDQYLGLVNGTPSVGTFEYDYYLNYRWDIPFLASGTTAELVLNYEATPSPFGNYSIGGIVMELDQEDLDAGNDNASIGIFKVNVGGCPITLTGFTTLGQFGDSKYYLSDVSEKPFDAQAIAENAGGFLVSINSEAENDFIQQNISDIAYIGLNDLGTEGDFAWFNGDAVTFTNFDICDFCYDNESMMDYVMIHPWDGGWSWSNVWNARQFIVEIPCTVPLQNNTPSSWIATLPQGDEPALTMKRVFPNPFMDDVNVLLSSNNELTTELHFVDIQGKVILTQKMSLMKGENNIRVSTSALPAGMYYVRVVGIARIDKGFRIVKIRD